MTRVRVVGSVLAAMLIGALAAGGARAQSAPDAPAPKADAAPPPDAAAPSPDAAPKKDVHKPKKAAKKSGPKEVKLPSVAVVVKNMRTVGLVELDAALSSGGDSVKIAGPLAAGKKTIAHLSHDKACQFDLHGSYADGAETDVTGVELCKDKKIDLMD